MEIKKSYLLWELLSYQEMKRRLFIKEILEHGAIAKEQYEKRLHDL